MLMLKVYLKNNWFNNIAIIVLTIILAVISKNYTKNVKVLFDKLITLDNLDLFNRGFLTIILLLIFMLFIGFYNDYLRDKAYWTGRNNLTIFFLEKIMKKDYSYFVKNKGAAINSDIDLLSINTSDFYVAMVRLLSKAIEAIVFTLLISSINKIATIICIALLPLIALANYIIKEKMDKVINNLMKAGRSCSLLALEGLSSVNNIKAKREENYFINKIIGKYKDIHKYSTLNIYYVYFFEIMINSIKYICPALAMLILININYDANLGLGEVIALFTLVPMVMNAYYGFIRLLFKYNVFKPYLNKIKEILRYKEDKFEGVEIEEFNELTTKNLKVIYENGQEVLIPDLMIRSGEKIMISGKSGIGKSTLFDIILGFKTNFEGSIKINGIDLRDINIGSIRKIFGVTFQNHEIFPMTLKENIVLKEKVDENYEAIINLCNLKSLIEDKKSEILTSNTVSGGEKSRVGIAQNLANNPKVILLDESFSNIDEDGESEILKGITKECWDKTVICISHRVESRRYFNRSISFDVEAIS